MIIVKRKQKIAPEKRRLKPAATSSPRRRLYEPEAFGRRKEIATGKALAMTLRVTLDFRPATEQTDCFIISRPINIFQR